MRAQPAVLAGLFLASPLAAQGAVWIVDSAGGPGADFTALQPAIDAAADGDTLLLRAGVYSLVKIEGRSLVLAADTGATPSVGMLADSGPHVSGTPAGGSVVLRGLSLTNLWLAGNAGTVWIEDAALTGRPGLRIQESADVVVVHSTLTGGYGTYCPSYPGPYCFEPGQPALRSEGSSVYLDGCVVRGGTGAHETSLDPYIPASIAPPTAGGAGAELSGGALWAARTSFEGGQGGHASGSGGGLFLPCFNGGDGGNGAALTGTAAQALECTFAGGAGGAGEFCAGFLGGGGPTAPGAPGQPASLASGASLASLAGPAADLTAASPVREGDLLAVEVSGEPFSIALVALASGWPSLPLPALAGVLHVAPPALLSLSSATGASGKATFLIPVPLRALPASIEGLTLRFQGASCMAACVLTPAAAVTFLDASL